MATRDGDPFYSTTLVTGKYSDLQIKCKGKIFNVHKLIVCLQSKPLAAMVDGPWKKDSDNAYLLAQEEATIFEKVLKFMYTGDYDGRLQAGSVAAKPPKNTLATQDTSESSNSALDGVVGLCVPQALVTNTKVLLCADRWDIPRLRECSVRKYAECLKYEGTGNSFLLSLEIMFGDWPEEDGGLKTVSMKHAVEHYVELVRLPAFGEMCRNNGEIGLQILECLADPSILYFPSDSPKQLRPVHAAPQREAISNKRVFI